MGWAALLAAVLLNGCAGDGPALDPSGGEFDRLQRDIFDQHCLDAGCHNAQSQAGTLNLSAGASYDALVNTAPDNAVARASGLLRVDPFAPENSFILIKLRGPGAGEGSRMPQGMAPLSASDIAAVESWIADGAPRGGTVAPTATPTPIVPSATVTETATATETATTSATPADTGTPTPSVTGTVPPTLTASPTPSPSPSPSPSPTPTGPALAEIQQRIFSATCVDDFCHTSIDRAGNLVLEDEQQSYAGLVGVPPDNSGVPPDNATARAAGLLRVDPGNPDNSFIVIKLAGPTDPRMGSRMPLGKLPLSAEEMQLIHDWIAAGAPP